MADSPMQWLENIGQHLQAEYDSVKARIEGDLPHLAAFVQQAAANPVVAALSQAVHLPEAPEVLETLAQMITKADEALGAAKAAGAAQAQQAAQADGVPPAEPA